MQREAERKRKGRAKIRSRELPPQVGTSAATAEPPWIPSRYEPMLFLDLRPSARLKGRVVGSETQVTFAQRQTKAGPRLRRPRKRGNARRATESKRKVALPTKAVDPRAEPEWSQQMNGRFELLPFSCRRRAGLELQASYQLDQLDQLVEEPSRQSRKLHVWSETPHGGDRVS